MKADKSTIIYALIDPVTREVRYIGKTTVKLNVRFTSHLRDTRPSWKLNWLTALRNAGLKPEIGILESMDGDVSLQQWQEAERFWISYLRFLGAKLTNLTSGGEGLSGHVFTPDHRKKIGDASRGIKRSPETCARMAESRKGVSCEHLKKLSEGRKGKRLSEEHRKKLSGIWLGRKHSTETIARMSAAALGRKCSPETRANMSEAQKNRTSEHQEKLSASKRGKRLSPEHCAKLSAAQTGRRHPPETIEKMRRSYERRTGLDIN